MIRETSEHTRQCTKNNNTHEITELLYLILDMKNIQIGKRHSLDKDIRLLHK